MMKTANTKHLPGVLMVNGLHIPAYVADQLTRELDGKHPQLSWESFCLLQSAGLVDEGNGLTEAGREFCLKRKAILDARKAKRNRARRSHDAALRSIGLVKTPYGWE